MSLTILVPLLVAIVGVLLFALTENKLSQIGMWLFICGTLVTLLDVAGHTIRI